MVVIVRVLTINKVGGTEVGGAPINSSLRRRLSVDQAKPGTYLMQA